MNATYAKLNTGDWGLRVVGETPAPGTVVRVTKKDGSVRRETVGRTVWVGQGVSLWTIAPKGEAPGSERPRRAAPVTETVWDDLGDYRRAFRPCGYPGCRPGMCDECGG